MNRSDACTRVHHQSARGVDRLLTTRVPRVYTTVHERSCRVSATVLTRDFAAIFPTNLRDKTDTDSRGVNDPRAATGITVAIDGGGRSRPEYHHDSMSRSHVGRQKAPALYTVLRSRRRAQILTE